MSVNVDKLSLKSRLVQILKLSGPLDKWGAIKMKLRLLLPLARGAKEVILDLRRVPFIDSDGLRALYATLQDHADVKVRVRNANKKVQRTLALGKLEHLLG